MILFAILINLVLSKIGPVKSVLKRAQWNIMDKVVLIPNDYRIQYNIKQR